VFGFLLNPLERPKYPMFWHLKSTFRPTWGLAATQTSPSQPFRESDLTI
jgi:hypothetical protein